MRFVVAILLVGSLAVHVLLGSLFLVSSKVQKMKAADDAGDLSSVAGDLDVSKEELDSMHAAATAQNPTAGRRDLGLGIGLLASALIQLVAVVLVLRQRARPLVLTLTALSLAGIVLAMVVAGSTSPLGVTTAILLLIAFGGTFLTRAPRIVATT